MILRKLKLNSLNLYVFKDYEKKRIDFILSYYSEESENFDLIASLYDILNLNKIQFINYPERIYFSNIDKIIFFEYMICYEKLYYDSKYIKELLFNNFIYKNKRYYIDTFFIMFDTFFNINSKEKTHTDLENNWLTQLYKTNKLKYVEL